MSKKSKDISRAQPGGELVAASYKAGVAEGRLQAIEESMDAIAALIFKAEAMIDGLGEQSAGALRDNAEHTLRALHLAFAAVTGSAKGSAACNDLLAQSRQRVLGKAGTAIH